MSDVTKSPATGANQKVPAIKNSNSIWKVLLGVFTLVSVACLVLLINTLSTVSNYLSDINQLEVSAANIVQNVNDATFSRDSDVSASAYDSLQNDVQRYQAALTSAQQNATDNKSVFGDLETEWRANKEKVDYVLSHRNDVNALQDLKDNVATATKQMQDDYSQVIEQAVAANIPVAAISDMQTQTLRAERLYTEMDKLTRSIDGTPAEFSEQAEVFAQTLNAQQQSYGGLLPALQNISDTFNSAVAPVAAELAALNSPAIESRENARALGELATNTQARLAGIDRDILTRTGVMWPAIIFLLGLLGVIYTLSQLLKQHGGTERILIEKETLRRRQEAETESERARQIQEENERNQMAILRLLDELGDLAEGDLTVNATVSEDFTGAIADSVNFAIDQLRQLVLVINSTAERVSQSSGQTQMNAVELAEASEHQAQEIASVSAAINEMAISIDQVSTNATESASVAQRSVAIAYNGADVVQRSIEGMNVIRDQIQETSKRIKRLGESSQEIGDIVSLINDIADQTNVLALNAAIQASMAGDAGRGFAVVADEVQRLAERSANATKQIETLVKTIQADTSEAVMSMETTTSEVVRGARLAKDAGEALEEVQSVSNTLADLIQNISNAAQQQAESAGHISNAMNIIQDITSQTSSGTMATARSVGELSEMAAALQESVTGFKISNDDKQVHDYEEDFQDHASAMA
ncbi:methyl-accepting chemotaxis protein [Psychrobacter sp. P11G5]|uniref:methyl-accepting chemotaxis protein n=1 Tax=Psychrobacter sp. P11G5 TaxID=1699624 RepID=UPI001D0CFFF9|nr:methyl-accepting chemotaxis protein [Psychrobacter sp. P11G5]